VTVLDASVIIAGFLGEPGRAMAEDLLSGRPAEPVMNGVNAGEVVAKLGRGGPDALNDVLNKMVWLKHGGLEIVNFDAFDGHVAGTFRAKYYDARARAISFADCAALATCIRYGRALATTDSVLARLAVEINIEVIGVPNSAGEPPL